MTATVQGIWAALQCTDQWTGSAVCHPKDECPDAIPAAELTKLSTSRTPVWSVETASPDAGIVTESAFYLLDIGKAFAQLKKISVSGPCLCGYCCRTMAHLDMKKIPLGTVWRVQLQ